MKHCEVQLLLNGCPGCWLETTLCTPSLLLVICSLVSRTFFLPSILLQTVM